MKLALFFYIFVIFSGTLFSIDLDLIVKEHPLYKTELNRVELARAKLLVTDVKQYPLFGTVSASTYGQIYEPTFNYSIGTSVSYELLNSELDRERELLTLDIRRSNLTLKEVYADLKYQLLFLLLQYIHAKEYYTHLQESYNSIESYTKKVEARYTAGDLSKSEKLYADSTLLKNRVKVMDADYIVTEAKLHFEEFSYSTINEDMNFETLALDSFSEDKNSLEEERSMWELENLETQKFYSAQYSKPSINLSGGLKFPLDSGSAWQIGVSLNYPIAGKKVDDLKLAEFNAMIENQTTILNTLKRDREMDIKLIKEKIIHLRNKWTLYLESLEISRASLEGVSVESNAGVRTVFDVINTRNSISDTEQLILETEQEIERLQLELYILHGGHYE